MMHVLRYPRRFGRRLASLALVASVGCESPSDGQTQGTSGATQDTASDAAAGAPTQPGDATGDASGESPDTTSQDTPGEAGEDKPTGDSNKEDASKKPGADSGTDVIALLSPKARMQACLQVGQASLARHGVSAGQSIECPDVPNSKMEVFDPAAFCESIQLDSDQWNCSMNLDQLTGCFDAAPTCSMASFIVCGGRVLACGASSDPGLPGPDKSGPKDAPKLEAGSLLVREMSSADIAKACAKPTQDRIATQNLVVGDMVPCEEGSDKFVEVKDPGQACQEFADQAKLDAKSCDLNLAELVACFDFTRTCDRHLDGLCPYLVTGCLPE